MKSIISFLVFLLIISCKQSEQKLTVIEEQIQAQEISKVEETILKTFTYEDIARYTMAAIMDQSPKIIKATKNNDLYYVSYIRKSDNQKFEYKLKFNGNEILWANIDGRWRDSQYDEKISFVEKDNKINIIQTFNDGSEYVKEYKKGE
jgi:broad specificity polyphosphatase/5'/3'-nucleotidase SurE